MVTTRMEGKMNKARGTTILIVVLAAASSARCRRSVRKESECTRRACAMLVPKRSVCTRVVTSARISSTPVREIKLCSASTRGLPGPHLQVHQVQFAAQFRMRVAEFFPTRINAWSSESPASTQMTVRSSASGSPSSISRWRFLIMRFSANRGRKKPKRHDTDQQ